jgi:ureidoglycolate lyase
MMPALLPVQPLTRAAFAPFGDVIETAGARHFPINNGTTERYHDLARVQLLGPEARALVSIAVAQPIALPFTVRMLERHPLGSQAFVPLGGRRFLVVVAGADLQPLAFLACAGQGVNYHANVWHHPLLALDAPSEFLLVDRGGPGDNCEEVNLPQHWTLAA